MDSIVTMYSERMRGDKGSLTRHLQGSRRQLEFAAACNLCLGMLAYYRIVLLSGFFCLEVCPETAAPGFHAPSLLLFSDLSQRSTPALDSLCI